jgi:hypothetical protein
MPWTCFALGLVLDLVMAGRQLGQVARGGLLNPDSYMRLVRLRDILAAGAPLHGVARDGSGTGTVLHWSHLLDSLLLLGAAPLTCCMDQTEALRWAGVALGPLGVGLLCAATAWAFAPLTDRAWRWTTSVVASLATPVAGYGLPGVVHHHILLALACVMTAGWATRAVRLGAPAGWRAGVWAAFGLWLSPETMPGTLMAFGLLGIAWLTRGSAAAGRALRAGGSVLLLLVAAIVGADPPAGGPLAAEIDRVSVVWLALALALAGLGWLLCAIDRRALGAVPRAWLGAALAAGLLGTWLAGFPAVLRGPDGLVDPEPARAMLGEITEMQPAGTLGEATSFLAAGALGAAVVIGQAWRRRDAVWSYAALCALAVFALGALHRRFATYGAVLGAGALPMAIRISAERLAGQPPWARSADRLALLALFLLAPPAGSLAGSPPPARGARCAVPDATGLLASYAGQVVLADVNDSPELLYRTDILTVGSLYHRNAAAFMRLRAAWRSRALADEPEAVRRTGAAAILVCPGAAGRSVLVADLPADTLLDRLDRGDPPAWLSAVGADGSGHVLYRVGGR